MPSLSKARELARTTMCKSNMRQLGIAAFSRSVEADDYVLQGTASALDRWWDAQSDYPFNYMNYLGGTRYLWQTGMYCPDVPAEEIGTSASLTPSTYLFNQFWWTSHEKSWAAGNRQAHEDAADPVRLSAVPQPSIALLMFGGRGSVGQWLQAWDRKMDRHGSIDAIRVAPPVGPRTTMLFADGHVALGEFDGSYIYAMSLDSGGEFRAYRDMKTNVRPE